LSIFFGGEMSLTVFGKIEWNCFIRYISRIKRNGMYGKMFMLSKSLLNVSLQQ